MQAFVVLWARAQDLVDSARGAAHLREELGGGVGLVDGRVAVGLGVVGIWEGGVGGELLGGSTRKIKVHICSFEEVIVDLILIGYRPYNMRADMPFCIKRLQPPPHARPAIRFEAGFGLFRGVGRRGRSVGVDPLLYLDDSRAIVQFVGDVGGLRADVADLADEGDLGDFDVVELEFGVWVGLVGVEDLADCDGAESVFPVGSLGKGFCFRGGERRREGWRKGGLPFLLDFAGYHFGSRP